MPPQDFSIENTLSKSPVINRNKDQTSYCLKSASLFEICHPSVRVSLRLNTPGRYSRSPQVLVQAQVFTLFKPFSLF